MKSIRRTIVEFLLLGVIGLAIALTANGVRAKNSIHFGKNYFDIGLSVLTPDDTKSTAGESSENTTVQHDAGKSSESKHLKHPYQEMAYDEVLALLR